MASPPAHHIVSLLQSSLTIEGERRQEPSNDRAEKMPTSAYSVSQPCRLSENARALKKLKQKLKELRKIQREKGKTDCPPRACPHSDELINLPQHKQSKGTPRQRTPFRAPLTYLSSLSNIVNKCLPIIIVKDREKAPGAERLPTSSMSALPTMSSILRKPMAAMYSRASSATMKK
jgi:hypothetical protein